jgi:hypothetical protein
MSDVMDLVLLRQRVGGVIATLRDHYTHEKLGGTCKRLRLPEPLRGGRGYETPAGQASFGALPDAALPDVTGWRAAGARFRDHPGGKCSFPVPGRGR